MIDKEKYLYWMNPDDPLLESQLIWREMYSIWGIVVQNEGEYMQEMIF